MKIAAAAATLVAGVVITIAAQTKNADADFLGRVDHLVFATPDLDAGIDAIEKLTGVRATPGGQHPGFGTRNALAALGPRTYLEIIGPDPGQPKPAGPRRFGIDDLKAPTLVTWVAHTTNLDQVAAAGARAGVKLGAIIPGSRRRPDGVVLSWRYTDPNTVIADRIVPYFIDWGTSPHPAESAARGLSLVSLRAQHPDAERVQQMLDALGVGGLGVERGSRPALMATITSPKGQVWLEGRSEDRPLSKR
jgi:hypothetical protein